MSAEKPGGPPSLCHSPDLVNGPRAPGRAGHSRRSPSSSPSLSSAMDPGPSPTYWGTLEAKGQHTPEAAGVKDANLTNKKPSQKRQRSSPPSPAQGNMVGCRFSHDWQEENGLITQWKGTILHQVSINPSLFMVKYDGVDCVYGLELQKDKRILALKFLPENIRASEVPDPILADTLVGKAVEHLFECEDGSKHGWRGKVLAQAPIMSAWFYITYEKDPILYVYQLLDDLKEGDLRVLPKVNEDPEPDLYLEPSNDLTGQIVEYDNDDGSKRVGKVIHQIEARPSVYFIKFDDDFHIYVYNLMKNS